MEPQSVPYDRSKVTDEQKKATEEKRADIVKQIEERVKDGAYQKHQNVLYPHEVKALPGIQKQALAETIVAWSNAPENIGFLETLDPDRVLEYIESNEVFAYITNGELLACARLHPNVEHQRDSRGRVVFGMAMKRPASFSTTINPEAESAFKYIAHARLVLCANAYPDLRPRAYIKSSNNHNIRYHLETLGLDEISFDIRENGRPIIVKLNKLIDPLKDISLPKDVIEAYTHD